MQQTINPLSWDKLKELTIKELDRIEGPNNAQASLRLFGKTEEEVRVTLYRDHHAWCPYCQKVWLWLEWKKIPYQIKKVTMRCYGEKETWYLKKVPSGMLPALELDNRVITESDQILLILEKTFGPLGSSLNAPRIIKLRNLERQLFRAWCIWLCNPSNRKSQEEQRKDQFQVLAEELDKLLRKSNTNFLDPLITVNSKKYSPGSGDVIFIPYLERMNASLAYYKGFSLRKKYPFIDKWFQCLEEDDVYQGTQGDFHTHSHDLPPQMGGCWLDPNPDQLKFSNLIDSGEGLEELESSTNSSIKDAELIALTRVIKHRECIMQNNPINKSFDQPLRAALTNMVLNSSCLPNQNSALGLRYLRDRISVPRDMPLFAARILRKALEKTATLDSPQQGPTIPVRNRFDQDPKPFIQRKKASENQ